MQKQYSLKYSKETSKAVTFISFLYQKIAIVQNKHATKTGGMLPKDWSFVAEKGQNSKLEY